MSGRTPAIGTLRDRVQILRKDMALEPDGGHTVTYTALATVWARVHTTAVRNTSEADGRATQLSHTIVFRYRSDVSPGDRLIHSGRTLDIISAEDLNGRRAYVSCSCVETQQVGS